MDNTTTLQLAEAGFPLPNVNTQNHSASFSWRDDSLRVEASKRDYADLCRCIVDESGSDHHIANPLDNLHPELMGEITVDADNGRHVKRVGWSWNNVLYTLWGVYWCAMPFWLAAADTSGDFAAGEYEREQDDFWYDHYCQSWDSMSYRQ